MFRSIKIEEAEIKLDNMIMLLDEKTLLSEEGFRKMLGFVIRIANKFEKYPELKDETIELARKLRTTVIMEPCNLDNVNRMYAELDSIIALNQSQSL